jgi:3-(3-hydroxy-phenyl)propionate hydroxylase
MLLPGERTDDVNTATRAHELMAPWVDPADVEVERSAVYTFHGLIATEWRRGRVLLAGDAAHQTPPFLGQGMCAGIRDAANLAWKLDAVIRGGASDRLLDTYQTEREPQVRAIVGAAVAFGRIICTTDVAVAAARDADLLAAQAGGTEPATEVPLPPLEPGPLVGAGGGQQAVQPVVAGTRLDDLVGQRFAVVTRTGHHGPAPSWWTARGAALLAADDHPGLDAVLDATGTDVAVIRPDRYLMFAGPTLEIPPPPVASLLGGPDA